MVTTKKSSGSMLDLPQKQIDRLDEVIKIITDIHLEHVPNSREFIASLPDREALFLVGS